MRTALITSTLSVVTLSLIGCGSPAKYVETGGTESIVSVGEVDIQDIQKASSGMLQSLIATGILNSSEHKPARLLISSVVNDTSSQFDVGEVIYRMREELVNSGQAQVDTTYGSNAEDKAAQEVAKRRAFTGQGASDTGEPDFSLTGRITQIKRSAGNTKQSTYTFRLTLTNLATGREVWTKTVDMTKQGTKNAVGM
ncbi:MAG: hypothetical protein O2819_05630 [Planctomycetota bacterium]|nr:hypothetical protein [Planctomycetota bacterium]MDA1008012.1 hypothetical protein [Planctomycetota bacterium]